MSNFYLMRKDISVCEFNVDVKSDDRVEVGLVSVFDEQRLPFEMRVIPNIAYYLSKRFSPTLQGLIGYSVLRENEPLGTRFEDLIDFTGGFSLIDDFWMKRTDDKVKNWDDNNLFSNDISEEISELAFSGEGSFNITGFTRSPEFTTDGHVSKAWRRKDGIIYLYKAGLPWKGSYASEQFSEYYAAQVAECLELNYVKYGFDMWMGQLCSVCELFTSEDVSYISARSIRLDINGYIKKLDRDSPQYQQLADTILFDALTMNIRHLGNFGFVQDNTTMEIIGLAPIFDNGMALLGEVPNVDLKNPACKSIYFMLGERMYATVTPEVIRSLLTQRQRKLANGMTGFKFRRHSDYNMSEERLGLLESIIHSRALYLGEAI